MDRRFLRQLPIRRSGARGIDMSTRAPNIDRNANRRNAGLDNASRSARPERFCLETHRMLPACCDRSHHLAAVAENHREMKKRPAHVRPGRLECPIELRCRRITQHLKAQPSLQLRCSFSVRYAACTAGSAADGRTKVRLTRLDRIQYAIHTKDSTNVSTCARLVSNAATMVAPKNAIQYVRAYHCR